MRFKSKSPMDAVPFRRAYWVIPGKLLAGSHPGLNIRTQARENLRDLLDAGIRHIIDLTVPDELKSYGTLWVSHDNLMPDVAAETGAAVTLERVPIADGTAPSRMDMILILDHVDQSIEAGKAVYVHCLGGRGRTGTVVGCYLIRHGLATRKNVLHMIQDLRKDLGDSRRPSPETWEQVDFIRSWVTAE